MVLIKYIPNKYVDIKYEHEVRPSKLVDAIYKFTLHYPEFAKPIMGKKSAVFVNGRGLNHEEFAVCLLKKGDIVEITHSIEDPIALIIGVTMMASMIGYLFYALGGWFLDLFDWDIEGGEGDSPTYTWDGPTTTARGETPIALIYGEHLVGGQYINFNIWSDGTDNWLDMLLALGEGEIAGVQDENQTGLVASIPTVLEDVETRIPYIKLNDQLVTEYTDCLWAGRSGTNNQTAIEGFRNQKSSVSYDHKVPAERGTPGGQWTSPVHTTNTTVDGFTVKLSCPALFRMYDSGKIKSQSVKYRIRHRVDSPEGPWIYSPVVAGGGVDDSGSWYTIVGKTKSETKEYKDVTTASRDTYDIQVQRYDPENTDLSTKKTIENKLNITHITEIVNEELAFPNTALTAISIKATDQISGSFPNVQTLVRGLKVRVPDLAGDGSVEFNDYYWTGTGLNYELLPGGGGGLTWDGSSYVTQWTSNPAYILRDLMLNTRCGFGEVVNSSDIDDDSIDAVARKCWQIVETTHKNEIHIVIDTENDPTSILAQLAQVSRIMIFWSGGYIKFKYDEDEDPIQLFTMGNIIKDSFKVNYIDHTKIPNRIEVTFADKDDGWKKNTIEVVDETEWALGKAKRTKSLNLVGVTDKAQALREAKLLLNKGRYVRKGIEFTTTIAACHSEPGDIIAFQHDVPQWGWGGRVISGTSTTCVIDQDMPQNIIDDPTAYDIKVMHSDDTIETYDIESVSGRTVTIGGIGDTFSPVPTENESYILGKVDSTIAEYRIHSISLTPEEEVQIAATEHSVNIYSDTGLEISDDESTELPNPSAFAPQVVSLTLYELYNAVGFGISFRQPESTLVWDHADVYISADNVHFTKIAEGYGDDDIEYYNVYPGHTYYIKVYSINKIGIKNTNPATANISIIGLAVGPPSSPTGLEIVGQGNDTEFVGRDCKVQWRLNAPFGGAGSLEPELPAGISGDNLNGLVKDFFIEIWDSTETTLLRDYYTKDKWYIYTFEKNFEDTDGSPTGSFVIKVYQRNYFNKISMVPARIAVSSDTPPNPTGLVTVAEEDGITFTWDETTTTDLDYYEHRTNVDGAGYSSWVATYGNKFTRWLTGSEIANQGAGSSKILISVRTVDVFGTTSGNTQASEFCDNFKATYIVGTTPALGHFSTIQSAVTAASNAGGGTIFIKEGSYRIATPIILPAAYINISGANRSTTAINLATSTGGFLFPNRSNKYVFSNFRYNASPTNTPLTPAANDTIDSMFKINQGTPNIYLESLDFIHKDINKGMVVSASDVTKGGTITVSNCTASGGSRILNITNCAEVNFSNNQIRNHYWGVYTASVGHCLVSGNIFRDHKGPAIGINYYSSVGTGYQTITNNTIITTTTATINGAAYCLGLSGRGIIEGNNIISDRTATGFAEGRTLLIGSKEVTVMGNFLTASFAKDPPTTDGSYVQGIRVTQPGCVVSGNIIKINVASPADTGRNIGTVVWNNADRALVSDNSINMVNSQASDIGIWIGSGSAQTHGTGNVIFGAGTGIDDDAGDSSITASVI
jgi:predicted phage tail protein